MRCGNILRTCNILTKKQNFPDIWFLPLGFRTLCHVQDMSRACKGHFQLSLRDLTLCTYLRPPNVLSLVIWGQRTWYWSRLGYVLKFPKEPEPWCVKRTLAILIFFMLVQCLMKVWSVWKCTEAWHPVPIFGFDLFYWSY